MFEPGDTGFAQRSYVFTTTRNGHISSDNSVSNAIMEKERIHFDEAHFFQLSTHNGLGSIPRGFYSLEWLGISDTDERNRRCKPHVKSWCDYECPEPVFLAFTHLIGDFLSLEEVVGRESQQYSAYRTMPADKLEEELDWARQHTLRNITLARESRERYRGQLLTPEQVQPRGLGFGFHCRSYAIDPSWFSQKGKGVPVDLGSSHLLGQIASCTASSQTGDLAQPKPFSLWHPQTILEVVH
jgi:hypothetical protein